MKIAVGGMIASGKSTLVKQLGEYLNRPIMEEFEKDDIVFDTLLKWLYTNESNVEMLLQVYFIHEHYLRQQKYGHDFIVDRDLIEHWLFAQVNLKKFPEVWNFYNGLFHAYMTKVTKPDLYIILDITFDTFLERLKTRDRPQEVDNLDQNLDYFKELQSTYVERLEAQCIIHNIPYVIIDVNEMDETQVLDYTTNMLKELGVEPKEKPKVLRPTGRRRAWE